MNKVKLTSLFLGLIFPVLLFGQFSGFDLSKYKLPDIKTDRLDLNFNLYNNQFKNLLQVTNIDTTETKQTYLSGALNISYYHFRNSEKYQGDLRVNAYLNPQLINNSLNELITKSNTINTDFVVSSSNIFFNQNKGFIEVDPSLTYMSVNERYRGDINSNSTQEDNFARSTTNLSIPVLIGKGRIEPVEDLRLAIYILEELYKAGRIASIPTENVIIEMAKEISQIKRKRFFDSRIRKIEELQVVDSFLVVNDIISSNDITYFSVLNDQWDYGYGPTRESGFAISAGIDNNVSFSKSSQEIILDNNDPIKSDDKANVYGLGALIKLRYARPINLYWQTTTYFSTSYIVEFTRNPYQLDGAIENFETNIFRTDLNYTLQFIPNSRTSFKLNIVGSFSNSKGERTKINIDPLDYDLITNRLTISPGLELYYYISPQLRVQFNSSFYLLNSNSLERYESPLLDMEQLWNRYQHNVSVNLIYSFF
jgi:hypothetical protein